MNGLGLCTRHASAMALLVWAAGCRWGAPDRPAGPVGDDAPGCAENSVAVVTSAGVLPCQARCLPGESSPCRRGEGCVARDDGAMSYCMPIYPTDPAAGAALRCPERGVAAVSSAGTFPCQARCQPGDHSPCRTGEGCVWRDDGAESWCMPIYPAHPHASTRLTCPERGVAAVSSAGIFPCQARCQSGDSSPCRAGEGCVARDDGAESYCMPIYPVDPDASAALACSHHSVPAVSAAGVLPCQARCVPGDSSPCRRGEGCVSRDDGAQSYCMPIYPTDPAAGAGLSCPQRSVAAVSAAGVFPCQARCTPGDSSPCRTGEGCVSRDDGEESYCMPIYPTDPAAGAGLSCPQRSVAAVSAAGMFPCQARCTPGDSSPCRTGEGCVSRDDGAESYCMPIYPTDPAASGALSCAADSLAAVSAAGVFPCQARCRTGESHSCRTGEGCVSRDDGATSYCMPLHRGPARGG